MRRIGGEPRDERIRRREVTRVGAVQVMPSVDVESTRSFCEQPARNRQSDHVA